MSQFTVNPHRVDPYKNFKFRVRWDGQEIAGVSRISGLSRATEVVEHREGGDPSLLRRSPGQTRYAPITLERGLTHDLEFERWANKVWTLGAVPESSLADFRKDITIELYNEARQLVAAWKVYRCWVSEFRALSELHANGNDIAIESLTLENEGWERDSDVKEPEEPRFQSPES